MILPDLVPLLTFVLQLAGVLLVSAGALLFLSVLVLILTTVVRLVRDNLDW